MSLFQFYALSDTLGMPLRMVRGIVNGKTQRKIKIDDLSINLPMDIVSSMVIKNDILVICTVMGKLGVAVLCQEHKVTTSVMILDLDKLPPAHSMLEVGAFQTFKEAVDELSKGTVAAYIKHGKTKFKKVL
jgi:hypothetical protein